MIASVARYLGHDPRLYGDIQMYNPYILDVHKKFMEVMNDFSNSVENKNEEQFINLVNQAKEYF
jgi:prephenate dehydrogenase